MSATVLAALNGRGIAAAKAHSDEERAAAVKAALADVTGATEEAVAAVAAEDIDAVAELAAFVKGAKGAFAATDAGVTAGTRAAAIAVVSAQADAKEAGTGDAAKARLEALPLADLVTAVVEPAVFEAMEALKAVEAAAAEADAVAEAGEAKEAAQAKYDAALKAYMDTLDAVEAAEKQADEAAAAAAKDAEAAAAKPAPEEAKPAAEEGKPAAATEEAKKEEATIRATAAEPYAALLQKRADALARLNLLVAVFADVADKGAKVTDFVSKFAGAWDDEITALQGVVDECDAEFKALAGQPPCLLPDASIAVADVDAQFSAVKGLRAGVEAAVNKDREDRATFDEKLAEFNKERERLLLWCRQEKSNLDGTVDVDAVQEFCATLLDHSPAMEGNLAVLLEMAEPLLPSPVVQAALLEANEVWLNLHIAAYERLRKTLLEVHERAKLEDEVRAYASYTSNATEYVKAVLKLLGDPANTESAELVADLVREAKELKAELEGPHAALAGQLRDFALRMEGFRDNYANLRRAVFSRLTFLATSVPTLTTSVRRKEEYRDRMDALSRWVQAKSRGESWGDIRSRVEKLRAMVADEKAAMAEEAPLSTETRDAAAA